MSNNYNPLLVSIPCLRIKPNQLCGYVYTEWYGDRYKKPSKEKFDLKNAYGGTLTPYAAKKLKRSINLLLAVAKPKRVRHPVSRREYKFRVNFITLTLSASQNGLSDKELKKGLLDNWLKRARRKYGLRHYVWRAERQSNGNIHYHIISDSYIIHSSIRNDWNDLQRRYHFIEDFKAKHGHSNPNSTDVHSVKHVRDLASYMVKYMTKVGTGADVIQGKVWDCSQSLKSKDSCTMELQGDIEDAYKAVREMPGVKIFEDQYYQVISLPHGFDMSKLPVCLANPYRDYIERLRKL